MIFAKGTIESKTGYFILEWESDREIISLFQKSDKAWTHIYTGELNQLSFSGLSNGTYEYALCFQGTIQPSKSICSYKKVLVEHYSPMQSVLSISIGLVLFCSIIIALIFFQSKTKGNYSA